MQLEKRVLDLSVGTRKCQLDNHSDRTYLPVVIELLHLLLQLPEGLHCLRFPHLHGLQFFLKTCHVVLIRKQAVPLQRKVRREEDLRILAHASTQTSNILSTVINNRHLLNEAWAAESA